VARSCRVATNSTLHQRFTRVRLPGSHLTHCWCALSGTLTTSAIEPTQLAVVWSLPLQSGSEGPRLPSLLQPASVRSTDYIDPSFCLRGARLSRSAVSLPGSVQLGADLTCQHRPRPVLVRRSPPWASTARQAGTRRSRRDASAWLSVNLANCCDLYTSVQRMCRPRLLLCRFHVNLFKRTTSASIVVRQSHGAKGDSRRFRCRDEGD
jgi:hypothetical protein